MSPGSLGRGLPLRGAGLRHSWVWSPPPHTHTLSISLQRAPGQPAALASAAPPSNLITSKAWSKAAFLVGGAEGRRGTARTKRSFVLGWESPESHSQGGNQKGEGRNPEKAPKSWSAGRIGLGWFSQSGDGQEAGPWIPQILLTETFGIGEAAPGSALPAVSAHFLSQPRGEAEFLPAPHFLSSAYLHPRR